MMPTSLRLFLAINLPAAERQAIHEAVAPLRAAARSVSWVAADKLHLTLKFIGARPPEDADALRAAIAPAAARALPATLELGGLGAFPDLRAPRVIWMHVHPDPRLELLHHDVETACAGAGYELDGRTFRPHITLGRVRERLAANAARALAEAARGIHYRGRARATSVEIMSTESTPQGSRYRALASLALAGGA
jgi:2'-5' RNA ligase